MKNYLSEGHTINIPAPEGGAKSGAPFLVGKLFGFFVTTAEAGVLVGLKLEGVFEVPRTDTATDWAIGDTIYYNGTDKVFTKTATGATKIGVTVAPATGAGVCPVKLVPTI